MVEYKPAHKATEYNSDILVNHKNGTTTEWRKDSQHKFIKCDKPSCEGPINPGQEYVLVTTLAPMYPQKKSRFHPDCWNEVKHMFSTASYKITYRTLNKR